MPLWRSGGRISGNFRGFPDERRIPSVVHVAEGLAGEFRLGEHLVCVGAQSPAEEAAEPFEDEESCMGIGFDNLRELVVVDGPDVGALGDFDVGAGLLGIDHVHFPDGFSGFDDAEFDVVPVGVAGSLCFA